MRDDDGEPVGREQADRVKADTHALRHALIAAAAFGLVVVVTSILAILFIWLAQAIGWWEISASAATESLTAELLPSGLHHRAAGAS
jgi:hypothetical protein